MDINQLIEFAGNHMLLVMAMFAIIAMLIGSEIQTRISGIRELARARQFG